MFLLTNIKKMVDTMLMKTTFALHNVSCGNNVVFNGTFKIVGKGKLVLSDECVINSGKRANPIGGDTRTLFSISSNATIIIGKKCGISNAAFVSNSGITLENNVFIGGGVKLYDTDFHSVLYEERIQKPDPGVKSKPILIKEGAFVGAHSIILKGVTIGKHSVVGAGSVVTRNIPDNEVWAGNPVKFIRRLSDEKGVDNV